MVFGEVSILTYCCRVFNWNKDAISRDRRGSKKQSLNLVNQGYLLKANPKIEEKPSRLPEAYPYIRVEC
jgi:hypothetical protein